MTVVPVSTPVDAMLTDLLDRLVLLQKAAVPGSDAVTVTNYVQEAAPYWTNRIDAGVLELESEEMVNVTFSIRMRLVLGPITSDYLTAAEKQIAVCVPPILYYFGARRSLKRTQADDSVRWLRPEGVVITDFAADYNMQNSGIGIGMYGVDFTLEVPMNMPTEQAVF